MNSPTCSSCTYWDMDYTTSARNAYGVDIYCQCVATLLNPENDHSPYACAGLAEVPVFTAAGDCCAAYIEHEDEDDAGDLASAFSVTAGRDFPATL